MRTLPIFLALTALCVECQGQLQQPVFGTTSVGTTVSAPSFGGIAIDANGVVTTPDAVHITALERKQLLEGARKVLPAEMSRTSKLRKVSLVRLEEALSDAIEAGTGVSPACRYLAGLTRIEYVIADPDNGDLIIAGPAEGFAPTATGAVVGTETGRPTLVLDDLLVMLRLRTMQQTLGCSFDPDQSQLARAQAWYRSQTDSATVSEAKKQFRHMADILGDYNVRIFGLPPSSHATLKMVDADYQMKRINLGLARTGIRGFKSQLAMMRPDDNSMRRYWFTPRYDQIERSVDGSVFRLSGPRLQLLSQEELVDAEGNRTKAAFTEVSTEAYTRQFNKNIAKLCLKTPAFAAVQNLFDMAVAVALIRQNELFRAVRWEPKLLMDEGRLPIMRCPAPKAVPAQVNTRTVGRSLLMFQIGGGVTLVPSDVVARTVRLPSEQVPTVANRSETWWWD